MLARDITERKRAERELRNYVTDLEVTREASIGSGSLCGASRSPSPCLDESATHFALAAPPG